MGPSWYTIAQIRYDIYSSYTIRSLYLTHLEQASLENIDTWVSAIEGVNGDKAVTKLLIGNKCDMVKNRLVDAAVGKAAAKRLTAQFLETSAKDSTNVDLAFLTLAKTLVASRTGANTHTNGDSNTIIKIKATSAKSGNCC